MLNQEVLADAPKTVADIVQAINAACREHKPRRRSSDKYADYEYQMLSWRLSFFNHAMQDKNYFSVSRPVERDFWRRCMVHAMRWMDHEAIVPSDPVEYNLQLHKEYRRRLDARTTEAHAWEHNWTDDDKKFDLNKKLSAVVVPLRTAVLQAVAVEFIAWLPNVGKTKARSVIEIIIKLMNKIKTTFQTPSVYRKKWPEGLWTPVLFAIMDCKNLKFSFTVGRNYDLDNDASKFAKALMTEIARTDNVNRLKLWINRCTDKYWDSEHACDAMDMALHLTINYSAENCYKYLCALPTNRGRIKGPDVVNGAEKLLSITMTYLSGTVIRLREASHYHLPPLLPSMLRLMWGKLHQKPAVTSFPEQAHWSSAADLQRARKSCARDYHWELVRRGVFMRAFRFWLTEVAQRGRYAAVEVDGQGLLVGDIAAADLDAVAKSRGLAVYERADTGGDTELALAQARAAQFRYRVQEARIAAQAGSSSNGGASGFKRACELSGDSGGDSDSGAALRAVVKAARRN